MKTLLPALALLLLAAACVRVTPRPGRPGTATPPPSVIRPVSTNQTAATHPPARVPPAPTIDAPANPQPHAPATPSTPPAHTAASPDFLTAFAVQLRLDNAGFSCGGIDGRWGRKSRNALHAWQTARSLPLSDVPDAAALDALGSTNGIFSTYVVTASDHSSLAPVPRSWLEKSKCETLAFSSIEEALGERFHTPPATLRRLNPAVPWPNPPAGIHLRVPAVSAKRLPTPASLEIRIADRTITALDSSGRPVALFPCSVAADKAKRPVNQTLHVQRCAENPDYTFDPDLYADQPEAAAIGRRLRIPPGPNNPVGTAWIGLDLPGYGIHGTPAPEDISTTQSHGCFRLTNWDATRLLRSIRTGTPVSVLP